MSGSSDCQPKRRIIEFNSLLSSATEFGRSTQDVTRRFDEAERERDELRAEVRLLEQRLQDEQEDSRRMSAALRRIAGLGSRCTSDSLEHPGEDCAQCIAEEALDA